MIKALQTLLEKIRREVRIVLFAALVACAVGGCATTTGTGGIAGVTAGMTKEQAAQFFRKQAERDPLMQSVLGMAYCAERWDKVGESYSRSVAFASLRNRLGIPLDCEEGAKWMRRAAEQGLAVAQAMHGLTYLENVDAFEGVDMGVQRDNKEAAKWIRRAAEQEVSFAQAMLGAMYAEGMGVPRDDEEAVKWMRRAAEQGLPNAQSVLGEMYAKGVGVPQDNAEAAKWNRRAEQGGGSAAQDTTAMSNTEISKWYHRAAGQGKPYAQYMLGLMYYKGAIVPQNYRESYVWLSLAAANRYDDAIARRDESAKQLSPDDLSSAQEESIRRHAEIQSETYN